MSWDEIGTAVGAVVAASLTTALAVFKRRAGEEIRQTAQPQPLPIIVPPNACPNGVCTLEDELREIAERVGDLETAQKATTTTVSELDNTVTDLNTSVRDLAHAVRTLTGNLSYIQTEMSKITILVAENGTKVEIDKHNIENLTNTTNAISRNLATLTGQLSGLAAAGVLPKL